MDSMTQLTPAHAMGKMSPSAERRQIRIVIADDHAVVRAGMLSLIGRQPDMMVVGEADSASEMVARARELRPDVIVADLRMPEGRDLVDAIRVLGVECPGAHVLVFSAFDDVDDAVQVLRAGATGYALKQSPSANLLAGIRRVRVGRRFIDPEFSARVTEALMAADGGPLEAALSEMEARVLELLGEGHTGPEIATELAVHVGTVAQLSHRLRKKLGLRSRAEVAEFARGRAARGTRSAVVRNRRGS